MQELTSEEKEKNIDLNDALKNLLPNNKLDKYFSSYLPINADIPEDGGILISVLWNSKNIDQVKYSIMNDIAIPMMGKMDQYLIKRQPKNDNHDEELQCKN
jgi:hypothetical protein